jgi:hypothetical protein
LRHVEQSTPPQGSPHDLARVSRLLADAYRLLSDQSLGRGELAVATSIGEARGKIAVAMKLLAEAEE